VETGTAQKDRFVVNSQKNRATVGGYQIYYRAYLVDYPSVPKVTAQEPFKVTIVEPPSQSDIVYNEAPDWLKNLED